MMRQKKLLIAVLAATLLAVPAMVQSKKGEAAKKARTLVVSFDYQRQAGPGSNQYAVWIENGKGDVVKTLFVTSYTTKGRARGGEQAVVAVRQQMVHCVDAFKVAVLFLCLGLG